MRLWALIKGPWTTIGVSCVQALWRLLLSVDRACSRQKICKCRLSTDNNNISQNTRRPFPFVGYCGVGYCRSFWPRKRVCDQASQILGSQTNDVQGHYSFRCFSAILKVIFSRDIKIPKPNTGGPPLITFKGWCWKTWLIALPQIGFWKLQTTIPRLLTRLRFSSATNNAQIALQSYGYTRLHRFLDVMRGYRVPRAQSDFPAN